jgi:hypothetical protein
MAAARRGNGRRMRLSTYFLFVALLFAGFSFLFHGNLIKTALDQVPFLEATLKENFMKSSKVHSAIIPRVLDPNIHKNFKSLAGISCDRYGGPSAEAAQEMVYWQDIPGDSQYVSPFNQKKRKRAVSSDFNNTVTEYLTFEPDEGGWNNIRKCRMFH